MSAESRQLLIVVLMLTGIGVAFLFSASAVAAEAGRGGDEAYFLKRQVLWAGLAFAGLAVCRRIPVDRWRRVAPALYAVTLLLLLLVLVPGIGAEINGARRWLRIGGWTLQPSELAKLSVALFVCSLVAADPARLRSFRSGFLPCFGAAVAASALIVVEPDLGTAAFLGLVMTLTLVVAGARMAHLLPVAGVAAVGAVAYAATHFGHVQARIHTWLHPEADPFGRGHQIKQSLIALGSGGWLGEGMGRGGGKLFYLPEVHSDFILPLIGQEAGFAGTAGVLLLFAGLGLTGWRISRKAATSFGALLSFAITMTIVLQAAMNVAVVTASMPTKGIPLPFLSYGGSSLVFTMCGVGILMAVADGREVERGAESCGSSSRAAEPGGISSPASPSPSVS